MISRPTRRGPTGDGRGRSWPDGRSPARLAAALLLLLTPQAAAQNPDQSAPGYISILLDRAPSPELQEALLKVVSADRPGEGALRRGVNKAVPADMLCAIENCDADEISRLTKTLSDYSALKSGAAGAQVFAPPGSMESLSSLPSVTFRRGASYILLKSSDPVYAAFRDAPESGPLAKAGIVAVPEMRAVSTSGDVRPRTGLKIEATALDSPSAALVAQLAQDVAAAGFSARNLRLPDAVDPTLLAALMTTARAEGAVIETTRDPTDVDIDWIGATALATMRNGKCRSRSPDWPFDASRLARLIRFNMQVLANTGVEHPRRAHIMVVDTGLPKAVAHNEYFQRFLHFNQTEYLFPSGYNTARFIDINQRVCLDYDARGAGPKARRHTTAFGYGAEQPGRSPCSFIDPLEHLEPPPPSPEDAEFYFPDHGGFVGVVAAGGPELMRISPGLDRQLGISFARVMRREEGGRNRRVSSEIQSVQEAIGAAIARDVDVLNMSLLVKQRRKRDYLKETLADFDGTVVAAAGNTPARLSPSSSSFPAALVSSESDNLIVVGGVQRAAGGGVEWWPRSSFSGSAVDIAAPASEIWSLNKDAEPYCDFGTSAAAPQVSFVAGLLYSYGFPSAAEVKRRILATADQVDTLRAPQNAGDPVVQNRVLNAERALDVFVDLIWLDGRGDAPIRARILPPPSWVVPAPPLLQACDADTETLERLEIGDGVIDIGRLLLWARQDASRATLWYQKGANEISRYTESCSVGTLDTATLSFINLSSGSSEPQSVSMKEVARIVPSRLRRALPESAKLLLSGE